MLAPRRMRPGAVARLLIPVAAATDLAGYAMVLHQQGGPPVSRVFFVGGFVLLLAALGLVALLVAQAATRALLFGFISAGGLVLGVLGIFSIGLPLLGVGALSIYALARMERPPMALVIAGAVAALGVLVVGFLTTSLP